MEDIITDDTFRIITITLLILIIVPGVFMNALCLYSLVKTETFMEKPSSVFILNLLFTQILQCLITIIPNAIKLSNIGSYDFRLANNDIFNYFSTAMFYGICLDVLIISLDRIMAMLYLSQYNRIITKRNAFIVQIIQNIYILVLSAIPFMNYHADEDDDFNQVSNYNKTELWSIIMLVANALIPFTILAVCYVLSFIKLRNYKDLVTLSEHSEMVTISNKSRFHTNDLYQHNLVTKCSLILTILFAILFLPHVIYQLIEISCSTCVHVNGIDHEILSFGLTYVTYLNVMVLPIIYWCYQSKFLKILQAFNERNIQSSAEYDQLLDGETAVTAAENRSNSRIDQDSI